MNPLEMDRHLGPVQASSVVMTKVVSFVHEVDLIKNGYSMRKVVLGPFRVVKSVLDPCGYCRDEVHAEKRNQHEHDPNSPVVDSDSSEVGTVPRYTPQQASSVLFIATSLKVGVWGNPQNRPNVVREIPQ